jgi:type IV pilus assembly protein PilB
MKRFQMLGEMLIDKGKLSREQLTAALLKQKDGRQRLGDVLVTLGFVTEWDVAECIGAQYAYEMIDPTKVTPDPDALRLIDSSLALSCGVLPIRNTESRFECVLADPIDVRTTDRIIQIAGKPVTFLVSPTSALQTAIRKAYNVEMSDAPASGRARRRIRKSSGQDDREFLLELIEARPSRVKNTR